MYRLFLTLILVLGLTANANASRERIAAEALLVFYDSDFQLVEIIELQLSEAELPTGLDGLRQTQVVCAIVKSAETGRVIDL